VAGSYVHGNEPSSFIKGGELIDQLRDFFSDVSYLQLLNFVNNEV
jgi:hypothetical protein